MTEPFFAPRFAVRISGLTMAADLSGQVAQLVVETDLDLAGTFSLVLRNADNTVLDSPLFDLGKTVEIHLGYGAELQPAFLGEITAIEPMFPADGPAMVRVSGYDKSFKLRRAQPEPTTWKHTNDSVLAARIAVQHGLIPVVDPTPGVEDEVQQVETDMAFLKARARRHFFDVFVEQDRLHFQFPRPQTAAHVLEWGRNLSSFAPRISSAGLAGLQVIRGYNQELAQTIVGIAVAADFDLDSLVERLGDSAVDLLAGLARKGVRKQPIGNPFDAVVLAKSVLADLLEGLYEGTGACVGLPDLVAGRHVQIRGIGRRFSGTYRLRKVTHRIDDSGFRTEFTVAQRSHTSLLGLLRRQLLEEPPPDTAEKFHGVVLATVVDNQENRDPVPRVPQGRVKVSYPGLSEEITSGWAPCARPMAGAGTGFYALPEVGDQVLVAFEHGELSRPYVLGALWTAQARPPETNVDGTNSKRVIRSRAGHTITFDDTADVGKLVVEDGGGSSIVLDATNGSIVLRARGDLTIKAGGVIRIEAAGGATTIAMDATRVDVS